MPQEFSLCPHCSADVRTVGTPGVCWHCKRSLSPAPARVDIIPAPAQAPTKANLGWAAPISWRALLALAFFLVVDSVIKTLMLVIAIPMMFIGLAGMIGTRYIIRSLIAQGAAKPHMGLLARLQLVSVVAYILLLPGYIDSLGYTLVFGVMKVDSSSLLVRATERLLTVSLVSYLMTTTAIVVSYVETRRALRRPA